MPRFLLDHTDKGLRLDGHRIVAADHTGRLPDGLRFELGLGARIRVLKCRVCGAYYLGDWSTTTCGTVCGHRDRLQRHLARQSQARQMMRERRQHPRYYGDHEARCGHCGDLFPSHRTSARYCSAACRQAAYRQRTA
jgi:hypothetical protein